MKVLGALGMLALGLSTVACSALSPLAPSVLGDNTLPLSLVGLPGDGTALPGCSSSGAAAIANTTSGTIPLHSGEAVAAREALDPLSIPYL